MNDKTETTTEEIDAELARRGASNIKLFPGVKHVDKPAKAQPNPDLIELLELYLAAARNGTLQEAAFALVWDDETTNYAWATVGSFPFVVAIQDLAHEHMAYRAKIRREKDPDYDDDIED